MPRYSYRAYDQNGALLTGAIDGSSREAALQALSARGEIAVDLAEAAERLPQRWWEREVFAVRGLRDDERLTFTRELATLVKADLPLDEALNVVALMPGLGNRLSGAVSRIRENVREGLSLSQALAKEGDAFPEYHWRMVRAGETSGAVGDVLGELASHLERASEMRNRIATAFLYPLLLLCAALAAVFVIMFVLLPAVMPLFAEAGAAPPLVLRLLSSVQETAATYWQLMLAVGLALTVLVALLRNDAGVRRARDRAVLRLPVAARFVRHRETARFCQTMAALLKNGVPLIDALRSTTGVMANSVYAEAVGGMVQDVSEGVALSKAMETSKYFPELALRLTSAGEKTGQLDVMLARAGLIHETVFEREADRATRLLGPLLTVFVGVFTGGLILSVMQAILSINDLALK